MMCDLITQNSHVSCNKHPPANDLPTSSNGNIPKYYTCSFDGCDAKLIQYVSKRNKMYFENSEISTSLHSTVYYGVLRKSRGKDDSNYYNSVVKLLTQCQFNVNSWGYDGETPLSLACSIRFSDGQSYITILAEHGAEVNKRNKDSSTPLLRAIGQGCTESALLLLKLGADPNMRNDKGYFPLHLTMKHNMSEVTKQLIQYGAIINVKDMSYCTPLHAAVRKNKIEVVQALLQSGANKNECDDHGRSCVYVAALNGYINLLKMLVEEFGAFISIRSSLAVSPLYIAIVHGNWECAQYLLNKNADVNIPNINSRLPIHAAIKRGRLDLIVQILKGMSRKTIVNMQTDRHCQKNIPKGQSLMCIIARSGLLPQLLKFGSLPFHQHHFDKAVISFEEFIQLRRRRTLESNIACIDIHNKQSKSLYTKGSQLCLHPDHFIQRMSRTRKVFHVFGTNTVYSQIWQVTASPYEKALYNLTGSSYLYETPLSHLLSLTKLNAETMLEQLDALLEYGSSLNPICFAIQPPIMSLMYNVKLQSTNMKLFRKLILRIFEHDARIVKQKRGYTCFKGPVVLQLAALLSTEVLTLVLSCSEVSPQEMIAKWSTYLRHVYVPSTEMQEHGWVLRASLRTVCRACLILGKTNEIREHDIEELFSQVPGESAFEDCHQLKVEAAQAKSLVHLARLQVRQTLTESLPPDGHIWNAIEMLKIPPVLKSILNYAL